MQSAGGNSIKMAICGIKKPVSALTDTGKMSKSISLVARLF